MKYWDEITEQTVNTIIDSLEKNDINQFFEDFDRLFVSLKTWTPSTQYPWPIFVQEFVKVSVDGSPHEDKPFYQIFNKLYQEYCNLEHDREQDEAYYAWINSRPQQIPEEDDFIERE